MMENGYFILILAELGIIFLAIIIKFIFWYLDNKNVNKILKYFDKRNKYDTKGFKKCLDIIDENKNLIKEEKEDARRN